MTMNKVDKALYFLNKIYYNGDRDECSSKHIVNGLCLLHTGKTPTLQDNFVDYGSSGISEEAWDMFRDDIDSINWLRVFEPHLWAIVESIYKSLSDKDKKIFMEIAHPYCNIEDDHWMTYYKEANNE